MSRVHGAEEVELQGDVPVRLERSGRWWQVIDQPTRLGLPDDAAFSALITHPSAPWLGWRFTAKADDGEVLVFDIRKIPRGWDIIRVYR